MAGRGHIVQIEEHIDFTNTISIDQHVKRVGIRHMDSLLNVRPLLDRLNTVCGTLFTPGKRIVIEEGSAAVRGVPPAGSEWTPLHHTGHHPPLKDGFSIVTAVDEATGIPLNFHVRHKRDKHTATLIVEGLMEKLPPNRYVVYTDKVTHAAYG